MTTRKAVILYLITLLGSYTLVGYSIANPLEETRCCIIPKINPDGTNLRRSDVLRAFQKLHPCPSTGLTYGACKGWAKDHVIPLESGGRDEVSNLQWLPTNLKSCKVICKDRWERKINVVPMEVIP